MKLSLITHAYYPENFAVGFCHITSPTLVPVSEVEKTLDERINFSKATAMKPKLPRHLTTFLISGLAVSFASRSALAFATNQPPSSSSSPAPNTCVSESESSDSETMPNLRAVREVMLKPPTHWVGDGFLVYPVFATKAFTQELSPFLMFDYAAPKTFLPNEGNPKGVGRHPHCGFSTVTIAFNGEVEHADSVGNRGVIKPGDCQWMTAGRGIIHEEYHSTEFSKRGGEFEMCQLWVNLPSKDKMTPPNYQPIENEDIPSADIPGGAGSVRVIAGSFAGTTGPATTHSPVELWDVSLPKQGAIADFPFSAEHNCIVFVRRGGVDVLTSGEEGDEKAYPLGPQDVALMERQTGDTVRVRVAADDTSLLIMGGKPLNEPIAARGPFVMNTQEELMQANIDYRSGNFGR